MLAVHYIFIYLFIYYLIYPKKERVAPKGILPVQWCLHGTWLNTSAEIALVVDY